MAEIIICTHCGERTTGKYCGQCHTAEGRREMDSNNKQMFEGAGLVFRCNVCEKELIIKQHLAERKQQLAVI